MAKKDTMTYEQGVARLEEIVGKLEAQELSLDEVVALYEEGAALAKACRALLDQGSAKLRVLMEEKDEIAEVEMEEEV